MKILLGRTWFGFGDWMMFTSIIKHINIQYPEVAIFIDTTSLPVWFLQFICRFDIRVMPICYPQPADYDIHIKHVTYSTTRIANEHLIESMVNHVNSQVPKEISFHLKYDKTCLANCIGRCVNRISVPNGKFVIIAPENGTAETSRCKDWDLTNFQRITTSLMRSGIGVVQIGSSEMKTPILQPGLLSYKDIALPALLDLMQRSSTVIAMENGISHFAGHHSIRTFTIYRPMAPTKPDNVWYPGQTAVVGEIIDPEQLAQTIMNEIYETEII